MKGETGGGSGGGGDEKRKRRGPRTPLAQSLGSPTTRTAGLGRHSL